VLLAGADGGAASGTGGRDLWVGGSGSSDFDGGAGDDLIHGGAGAARLDGGDGTDTVVFSGDRNDYVVSADTVNGTHVIEDTRAGWIDGADTVINVEFVQFTDGVVALADLLVP
jgi:Ca2+-binding RTX toxin-like protein